MVGREYDWALELSHPLAPLHLGVSHRLGEREQQAVLDQPPYRPHGLLTRPSEVACRRRHDSALRRPRVRARRVPTPASPDALDVTDDAADGTGELHGPA